MRLDRAPLSAALLAAICFAAPSSAQTIDLEPSDGIYDLPSGFAPDPLTVALVAGGPTKAAVATAGRCVGFVADAPHVRLRFPDGEGAAINLSALSHGDTTLIVNGPDGTWLCDDDGGNGVNPLLALTPVGGQYDIWVGSYSPGPVAATLSVSALPYGSASAALAPRPAGPDRSLSPSVGAFTLRPGFRPDPYEVELVAGGDNSAAEWSDGRCSGYVADAPNVRVTFEGGSFPNLYFSALSRTDTTLVIAGPNGTWFCENDSGNSVPYPMVRLAPTPGQYDIWLGTSGPTTADAVLAISERYWR